MSTHAAQAQPQPTAASQPQGTPAPDRPEVSPAAPWLRRVPLRSPTLPPATHTNVYVVGEGDLLAVDPASPYPEEQQGLLATLEALAAQGHRLRGALLTHHHYDHTGGADALRRALPGLTFYAHALTAERLAARGLVVDQQVREGDVLPFGPAGLRALHTPGHAPGHLCLIDQAGGGVIVGDMVASQGTIVIDPEDDGDMARYLLELTRLLALAEGGAVAGAQRLWPAHGVGVAEGPALLRFYIQHRLQREAKVAAALAAGAGTLWELVPRAYDDVPAALHPLAVRALQAHLLKLASEGRAQVEQGAGAGEARWHPIRT